MTAPAPLADLLRGPDPGDSIEAIRSDLLTVALLARSKAISSTDARMVRWALQARLAAVTTKGNAR